MSPDLTRRVGNNLCHLRVGRVAHRRAAAGDGRRLLSTRVGRVAQRRLGALVAAAQELLEGVAKVLRTEPVDERIGGRVAVAEPEEDSRLRPRVCAARRRARRRC